MAAARSMVSGRVGPVLATRLGLALVGALLLLALALPWGTTATGPGTPGFYTPGSCTVDPYDGSMFCTGGFIGPGFPGLPGSAVTGFQQPVRVLLVAGLVLCWWGVRRARAGAGGSRAVWIGLAVAAAGGLTRSTGVVSVVGSGRLAYLAAIALAALAVRNLQAVPDPPTGGRR
jgi:hypothetical protein